MKQWQSGTNTTLAAELFYFKHMNDDRKVANMAFCDVGRALAQLCYFLLA